MYMIGMLLIRTLDILSWAILIQCLMSWFPGARYSKIYETLNMFTEPLIGPIRELLFRYIDIPVDFSPILAFFVISTAQKLIVSLVW